MNEHDLVNARGAQTFISLQQAAYHIGVPAAWLRREAEAGRVPYLQVCRQMLFNLEIIEDTLIQRAQTKCGDDSEGPR